MNDVLEEFFLRGVFADGFPADLGEAGVLEQGDGDGLPKVALSLRDRSAECGEDADWTLQTNCDSDLFGAFGFPVAERQGYVEKNEPTKVPANGAWQRFLKGIHVERDENDKRTQSRSECPTGYDRQDRTFPGRSGCLGKAFRLTMSGCRPTVRISRY